MIGTPQALDPHLSSGSLKGMIDMRDQVLGGLSQTLGNLAQQTAQAFNAQSNANTAYPPPTSLSGRDTGLISGDALNFSGKTTIAVADASGNLVSRIDVNFGAGTLSVNGGAATSIGTTVGSFTTALNTALGSNGSASFANGQLQIAATGGNGVVVQDDATTPSSRAGTGFSQFFGLNDLFQSGAPSILATGLSASDLQRPGRRRHHRDVAQGTGWRHRQAGQHHHHHRPDGGQRHHRPQHRAGRGGDFHPQRRRLGHHRQLAALPELPAQHHQRHHGARYHRRQLHQDVRPGQQCRGEPGGGLFRRPHGRGEPGAHRLFHPRITATSVAGDTVVLRGDNSGAIALQNTISNSRSFAAAGGIAAQVASLSDYAAGFYQDISTQSNTVTSNQGTQDDRLAEAQSRIASNSGVNLDEELTNMTTYQQAYSAGARMLSVVDQLYQTLLQIQ